MSEHGSATDELVAITKDLLQIQRQTYVKAHVAFILAASSAIAVDRAGGRKIQAEFCKHVAVMLAAPVLFDHEVRALLVEVLSVLGEYPAERATAMA